MGAAQAVVDETRAGPVVRVRARPRARRDAIEGVDARGLRVAVRAAPERGKANAAVLRVLAGALGVPVASLELASGDAARDKRVLVRGLTVGEVRARLGL